MNTYWLYISNKRCYYEEITYEGDEEGVNSPSGRKVLLSLFQGKFEPKQYLEWERKVEDVFYYYNLTEEEKVKLAIGSFTSIDI